MSRLSSLIPLRLFAPRRASGSQRAPVAAPPAIPAQRRPAQPAISTPCAKTLDNDANPPPQNADEPLPRGFVYVIGSETGPFKVGFSRNVKRRLRDIQAHSPIALRLHFTQVCATQHPRFVEARAHELLERHHSHGEWFACALKIAIAAVRCAAAQRPTRETRHQARSLENKRAWADSRRAREAWDEYRRLRDGDGS